MAVAITKKYQMNLFDPNANSNKVWIGLAYTDGKFETRYGRVRESAKFASTVKQLSSAFSAETLLERRRKEKLRKGYRDCEVFDAESEVVIKTSQPENLSRIAAEQITGCEDKTTADLVKYLAEVNIHNICQATSIRYNSANATFTTPLGILTPDAVLRARHFLSEINLFNQRYKPDSSVRANRIRDYFQLVPKDFGMRVPPVGELLSTKEQIERETAILDALDAALTSSADISDDKIFKCRLSKLPHWTDEGRRCWREIRTIFEKTRNDRHIASGLKLVRIYEVEIDDMKSSFLEQAKKLGNIRQDLWHGTRASNLLSILKNGLIIPPSSAAHCTGRMFGNGIYTSLQSTKALNYATNMWNSSGANNQRTFMFLCEAALGKSYQPSSYGENFPKKGSDSTWVEAGCAGVINHECIVYDAGQINLRYLCEFGKH